MGGLNAAAFHLTNLPGSKLDSRLRTSWRVSMLKRPISPFVKDVTRWAGSLHTRSTEEGTPSSCTQKDRHIFMLIILFKQILRKNKVMIQASTFVFVEYCEGGGGGVGVPQSHGPVCRAGEEALVCAAVHQTPNGVSVSQQRAAQHRRVWHRKHKVSYHHLIWKPSEIQTQHNDAVTVGVVGVDVGIWRVPALYSPVNPSAETLLPCTAHHHTQYSPPVVSIIMN